ncbi:hypothetical protein MTR67_028192 [Solanum verrucosum]|uniref:Reverse transcriptase domain-containing protein n=1 Tax=Solanum verrucosum TaxID=315347 RepID=A0AAF0TVL1_SOLVR|nr:hypothetical protein MTR67_028192 [Solanum verrucosum]
MMLAIKEFFQSGKLYRPVNCTVITLVPKNSSPVNIKEYRPIACCTIIYKIIAKVLASRMQKVMARIISEAQSGFIPGRKIVDNIILATELVKAYSRQHISPRCMLKIDLQKAYDSVEWSYLEQANMNKCSIYFGGVPDQVKLNILQQSGFGCGEFPFKYLGVPLSTKKLTIMQWSPLVNKIIARISSWTAKKLSYAGRMQLVQSVLFGIQAYWSQLFIIPAKVLKLIESYCRSFTWSGSNTINKRALIAWEKVQPT